jgi:hypothetical protein
MADVTSEQAQWIPPGKATPIGANYIHLIQAEDAIVQTLLQNKDMLGTSTWAGRIGATEGQPLPGTTEQDYFAWTRRVQLDLPQCRLYAKAVYAASDDYLVTLKPEDLDEVLDLSSVGMAPVTRAWVISRYLIGHADNICGETSTMKGLQGARGYAE